MSTTAQRTRFDAAFASRDGSEPGLIPYLTAGFPSLDATPSLLLAAQQAGAMAVEVGIPFSDPLADGPTIQRAGWRALRNGMTLATALRHVAAARDGGLVLPLAVMTYVNPVLAYGLERFAKDARASGADGLIVPDLPDGEAAQVRNAVQSAGIDYIPLVAPTTPQERVRRICEHGSGFVYCVSVTGVTGARDTLPAEADQLLQRVREVSTLPRALGFGLSTREQVRRLSGTAEAAVVGSALIDAVDSEPADAAGAVERFCRALLGT